MTSQTKREIFVAQAWKAIEAKVCVVCDSSCDPEKHFDVLHGEFLKRNWLAFGICADCQREVMYEGGL